MIAADVRHGHRARVRGNVPVVTTDAAFAAVEDALGYRFQARDLLREALTHRSFAHERPNVAPRDNERLEFLGDAVINLAASALLWERFPQANEGELTRRRADVVCEAGLASIARELGLGPALQLGRGEERSGGRDKARLLASAFEGCMGAIYLDGGAEIAFDIAKRLFEAQVRSSLQPGAGDYKSRVQELVQARMGILPTYELVRSEGPDHERRFFVALSVNGSVMGEGSGRSKLEAEQSAAREAFERLSSSDE